MASKEKEPFHVTVANKLIEQLQKGQAPWQKPWNPGVPGTQLPNNPVTGKRYNGINILQLMSQGYSDTRWLTYKQADAAGWQVRKGEKGTQVQYWKFSEEIDKTDENGNIIRGKDGKSEKETLQLDRPRVFRATVFNAEQIDGIPQREIKEPTWNKLERIEALISATGATVVNDQSDRAFYRLSTDKIHMPGRDQFDSPEKYYAVELHELGHWTGHPSRLDRSLGNNPFGSEEYAKEELRAEISSMIMGDELGLGHDPGMHVGYVKSWIKVLKDDPMEIFRAASDAEKIQKFVMAFEQNIVQQENQSKTPSERYEELLMKGGRLVDRLEESGLMSINDAMLTDAKRDLASMSVAPEQDRYTYLDASEKALGTPLPVSWAGGVGLQALSDGESWDKSASREPNGYAVLIDNEVGERNKVAVFDNSKDALVMADRLLTINAYARHEASKLEELAGVQHELESAKIGARLELLSSRSYEGNDPLVSWHGLEEHAKELGLKASIQLGGEDSAAAAFVIRYTDKSGSLLPITTELNEDGKAVSLVDEKRVPGKGLTSDIDWQKEALSSAVMILETQKKKQEEIMESRQPAAEKTFIHVPFKEKNEAKELGARWDSAAASWFVPAGVDLQPFEKWREAPQPDKGSKLEAGQEAAPTSEAVVTAKKFLAVPYGERQQASAMGARWDKAAKSWFIGQGDDLEKFKRWDPEHVATLPKVSVKEEFKAACEAAGLKIAGEPIMDGKRYRVPLLGDKSDATKGVYIGHLDGHPAGYIENFKTGVKMNWKSKGYSATDEEKAKIMADAAQKLEERTTEREEKHQEVASKVQLDIQKLQPPIQQTTYLAAKGVVVQKGVLTDKAGKRTYIPAQDINGKVWTVQYIRDDGSKRFPKGGRKEGCFHVVGGMDALAKAPVLAIGEGYATMSTATESLGFATVAAFDSGNLKQVAAALQQKYPGKPLLIIGDDDVLSAQKSPSGINAGRNKAEEAARSLSGTAVFPAFAPGELQKGLSDFNDMATKSELGRDGVDRQLKAAVSRSMSKARERAKEKAQEKQIHAVGFSR